MFTQNSCISEKLKDLKSNFDRYFSSYGHLKVALKPAQNAKLSVNHALG